MRRTKPRMHNAGKIDTVQVTRYRAKYRNEYIGTFDTRKQARAAIARKVEEAQEEWKLNQPHSIKIRNICKTEQKQSSMQSVVRTHYQVTFGSDDEYEILAEFKTKSDAWKFVHELKQTEQEDQ